MTQSPSAYISSNLKKHGWLEMHGNPSCAIHPLKMVDFPSHVRFPEGIPRKTNSHFSDPRFSSIWRTQNHLPFLGFVSPLGFGCKNFVLEFLRHFHTKRILSMSQEMFRNVGLGHGILQFAHIPLSLKVSRIDTTKKWPFPTASFFFGMWDFPSTLSNW